MLVIWWASFWRSLRQPQSRQCEALYASSYLVDLKKDLHWPDETRFAWCTCSLVVLSPTHLYRTCIKTINWTWQDLLLIIWTWYTSYFRGNTNEYIRQKGDMAGNSLTYVQHILLCINKIALTKFILMQCWYPILNANSYAYYLPLNKHTHTDK